MTHRRSIAALGHLALGAAALLVAAGPASAADATVGLEGAVAPNPSRAGEVVTVSVEATVPEGYHLYVMTKVPDGPMQLTAEFQGEGLTAEGPWYAPSPKVDHDPNFDKNVEYYEGTVTHRRAYRVGGPLTEADRALKVRGQICNPSRCIPFKEVLSLTLDLEDGPAREAHAGVPTLEGVAFDDDRRPPANNGSRLPTEGGLIGYLLFAFLAGLAALLTPCVFPMIPITVSFFSKYSEVSLRRSAIMASVYTGSIILTFTLLGVLVSVIFGAVGMQVISSSAFFNLFLFALLVIFSLNLFGLFEIKIPNWLVSRSSEQEHKLKGSEGPLGSQMLGVFFMALTFTLVSFTCTVAFIGLVLAEAAKGNWFYPTLGMLAFSTGFSIPFFLLAMFPSWAHKLRGKGGDWMVAVKVTLGFLELAAAFKFLSNVDLIWQWGMISRTMVLACWAAIFFVAGLYLLRLFLLPHNDEGIARVSPLRMCAALLMFALAIHCASGLRDTKSMGGWLDGWLPPAIYPGQEAHDGGDDGGHLPWLTDDIPGGMTQAKAQERPLFIDFTGYTCTNCRYMEGSMFPRPAIRKRLERMVLVTAYTDGSLEVHDTQRETQIKRFDTAALPFYAIIDPFDDTVLASFADMTQDPSKYAAFLDKGLAAFDKRMAARVTPTAPAHAAVESAPAASAITLAAGGPVVDLTLPRLSGEGEIALSSLRGKWVLLNFWASWCSPCKKELREDFPRALANRDDVVLVTVAFDEEEGRKGDQDFIAQCELADHVHLFAGAEVDEASLPHALGAQDGSLPVTYLIDPAGRLTWQRRGSIHAPELSQVLDARPKAP